jgi:hypothetical protein
MPLNIDLADGSVGLAKVEDVATSRILGRTTAGDGAPEALTGTQATTILNAFTSGLKGLAPASGGGEDNFLRADGTWAEPAGEALGYFNVMDYDATGDGVTDDSTALRATVAAAEAAGGGVVYFPAGTYLISRDASTAWCLDFAQLENITLLGVKGMSIIKAAAGMPNAQVAVTLFNGGKRITIRDLAFDGGWGNAVSTITWASDGDTLPQATINIADTTRFASAGSAEVDVGGGVTDTITWTGKTASTLTGCSGGTGALRTGACVGVLDANTGLDHTTQADPKNHLIMLRGCEDVSIENCTFENAYGDFIWLGFRGDPVEDGLLPCRNVRIDGCVGEISARNGITLGQITDGVAVTNCEWRWIFSTAFDVEAQGANQYVRNVTVEGGFYGLWWNPAGTGRFLSQSIAITGAATSAGLHLADAAHTFVVDRVRYEGSLGIWGAKNVKVANCTATVDFDHGADNGSYAPIYIDHIADGFQIINNTIYDRGKYDPDDLTDPEDDQHYAAINVQPYADSLRPIGGRIIGNTIECRNGRAGIKVAGAGNRVGGTQEYTAATITASTVVVTAAGWATNAHAGKTVYIDGVSGVVSGNNSDTLAIVGWFLPTGQGSVAATPAAGAFRLYAVSGVVVVEANHINCFDDGYGAGGQGIFVYAGLDGMAVRVRGNHVTNATGEGIRADLGTFSKLFELSGNHVYDDQETPTTTTAFYVTGVEDAEQTIIFGNHCPTSITHMGGITAGTWQTSDSYPGSWAGYDDPNGTIYAPASSTYHRLNSSVIYIKQSPVSSAAGWQPALTVPRANLLSVGTPAYGAGALTPGLPASIEGCIEIMVCMTFDAAVTQFADDAGFQMEIDDTSLYLGATNRSSVWWRRFRPGMGAPTTIVHTFDYNAIIILSFKDIIGYGNPFSDAQSAGNDGVGLSISCPTATSDDNNSLVFTAITWFAGGGGGTPATADSWANASLTEIEEASDNRMTGAGEIFSIATATGRDVVAGATGATTAQLYDAYAIAVSFTLVMIPAVVSARSSGTITCVTKANLAEGDYCTVGDGIVPAKLYEFDLAPNGVVAGRIVVDVSGATSAADVAAILRTAILANQPSLGVVDNADGTLTITHQWPGDGGNVTMTENVTNAGFLVTGLTGGQG